MLCVYIDRIPFTQQTENIFQPSRFLTRFDVVVFFPRWFSTVIPCIYYIYNPMYNTYKMLMQWTSFQEESEQKRRHTHRKPFTLPYAFDMLSECCGYSGCTMDTLWGTIFATKLSCCVDMKCIWRSFPKTNPWSILNFIFFWRENMKAICVQLKTSQRRSTISFQGSAYTHLIISLKIFCNCVHGLRQMDGRAKRKTENTKSVKVGLPKKNNRNLNSRHGGV